MTNIVRRCRGEVEGEELGGVNEDRDRDVGKDESEAVRAIVNRAGRLVTSRGCSVKKLMGRGKHRTFPAAGPTRTEKRYLSVT